MLTKLRIGRPQDEAFIFNSWLKANEKAPCSQFMLREVYYSNHKRIVANLLKSSKVVVVCNADDDEQIYGYMVFSSLGEMTFLHFLYVKSVYRKLGIARQMMEVLLNEGIIPDKTHPVFTTHASRFFPYLRKGWNLIFNPYLIERIAV